MNRNLKRLCVAWSAACVLFAALTAAAQEGGKTIRDARDILPESVVRNLDKEVCMNLLKKTPESTAVPLFVMVNPALSPSVLNKRPLGADESKNQGVPQVNNKYLAEWIESWAGEGVEPLSKSEIAGLTAEQDGAPALYSRLEDTSKAFMEKFFGNSVEARERLFQVILESYYKKPLLLVAGFNVRCWKEGETGKDRIVVKLTIRIQRIVVNRDQYPDLVESVELLFRDEALGHAILPSKRLAGSDPERHTREVQDAYQAAIVDALRSKIALSLWHNARMSEEPWAHGQREKIVSPSLSDTK